MKVHILQHVPFEGLGSIQSWLDAHHATVSWTRFYAAPELPDPASVDFVIALGGPMSVNDESQFPWLVAEKRFVRALTEAGKPLLGICLGAQLIAQALGAAVYPNRQREIGWFPIENLAAADAPFRFPATLTVFHWHGETFDLPPGARHLARSAACENQAFLLGENVLGLQFHLETTPDSADAILKHCRDELQAGTYVQDEPTLRAAPLTAFHEVNRVMTDVLDYLSRSLDR